MIASPLSSPSLAIQLEEVGQLIGNTPLMPIRRAFNKPGVELYAKLEWRQLGHSVKSRPAFFIIKDAIEKGLLTPEKRLLDASSGNTAIGYATVCARLGIPLTICIPENASPERKQILTALGAELIYTSPMEKTDGAQLVARQMVADHPDRYFYADQYNNDNNWKAHYHTTGQEVFAQTGGRVTHLAVGVGTTGTLMGTGRRLRELNADIEIVSLHPDSALHGLEGWKDMETARVPGIYDAGFADQQLHVSTEESYEWLQKFAQEEGVLISPSAAANLAAIAPQQSSKFPSLRDNPGDKTRTGAPSPLDPLVVARWLLSVRHRAGLSSELILQRSNTVNRMPARAPNQYL